MSKTFRKYETRLGYVRGQVDVASVATNSVFLASLSAGRGLVLAGRRRCRNLLAFVDSLLLGSNTP